MSDNPQVTELPGTEATVLYDEDAKSLYIRLRPDTAGRIETQQLIASPMVNVDLVEGEAVGIEVVLP